MSCFRSVAVPVSVALLALLLAPPPACADERALWVSSHMSDRDDVALRAAVAQELGTGLLDTTEAAARLRRDARRLPPDDRAVRVAEAERAALDAYLHLRFADALDDYERAMEIAMSSRRSVADRRQLGRLAFGRALVRMAAHQDEEAELDLALALTLDPALDPDPGEYGPPVFRAIAATAQRMRLAARVHLRVDRAPSDAVVHVDGTLLVPGEAADLTAGVRHLLTVERAGHVPESRWIETGTMGEQRAEVVLAEATGALLSWQALEAWRTSRGGDSPRADLPPGVLALMARATGTTSIVSATGSTSGEIDLRLLDAPSGPMIREARGQRVPWEVTPFAVLAAALGGRVIDAPPPADVAVSVSAPTRVAPGEAILVRVRVQDPERRVHRIAVRCGRHRASLAPGAAGASLLLSLDAPEAPGTVSCAVQAIDAEGRLLGGPPNDLVVQVAADAEWGVGPWLLGAAGVAVAAAILTVVLVATSSSTPEQLVKIHGP